MAITASFKIFVNNKCSVQNHLFNCYNNDNSITVIERGFVMDKEDNLIGDLIQQNNNNIVLLVMDGVGDIPNKNYENFTPLEYASTPNLDKLAKESVLGRHIPVLPGVTPGSGPGHLGIFGYDPMKYEIGRGILEAAGMDMEIKDGDIAVRCNFASADEKGIITDRRAGRISTEKCEEICAILSNNIKEIDNIKITIKAGIQHRFVVIFTGEGLSEKVTDSDPLMEGKEPFKVNAMIEDAAYTAEVVNKFYHEARKVIRDLKPANSLLMRGFSERPRISTMSERFGISPVCIAHYPMYKGLSRLVGMNVLDAGNKPEDAFNVFGKNHANYNYFFIHIKYTDSYGEDGNFLEKVKVIEAVDSALPLLLNNKPDVLCITGDHSTPVPMKSHSWHPVPVLINSEFCGFDDCSRFTENECNKGGLGIFQSKYLINYLLANALKLSKYGA